MDQHAVRAREVIASLRSGTPPERGVSLYSVGNEVLISGIRDRLLADMEACGIIRFISGTWGSGKTHFLRQIRDVAQDEGLLVSTVELDTDSAAMNKFETVYETIVRNIASPRRSDAGSGDICDQPSFGGVLAEALAYVGSGQLHAQRESLFDYYEPARQALMSTQGIDIDFKKMVAFYWKTFRPEASEDTAHNERRGEILDWFYGQGTIGAYRKTYGVNKILTRANAKLMLQSLVAFVRLVGYKGFLILLDESNKAFSVMRKAALKDAHNNLLSLINSIGGQPGLFLLYAATPDFYNDPKYGIQEFGALAGRIGMPKQSPPRALDRVWNFDAQAPEPSAVLEAATKIRDVYGAAMPDAVGKLPTTEDLESFLSALLQSHSKFAGVSSWRLAVVGVIEKLDDSMEGRMREPAEVYRDVVERLREP